MTMRPTLSIAVIAVIFSASVALAEDKEPETWHVSGVAANDVLNARMGPGTDYPVIETFAPDEAGLERITCVPFYTLRQYKGMTDAQLDALPPRWCLMRGADRQRAGWVAQQFLAQGDAVPTSSEISNEDDPLGRLSSRFLDGYEELDALQVLDEVIATLEPVNSQSSPFLPSAQIRPMTMAVLALEAVEGVRDRVRYRISYGIEQFPDGASRVPYPVSFIQVDRFSLGSAIRQDAIESHGAEQVAPPEVFDVGPHVSWRVITRPVLGTASDIVAAGRTEVSDAQAQDMTCLNRPCLSPVTEVDNAVSWGAMEQMPLNMEPVPFQVERSGLLTPAAAIEELTRKSRLGKAGLFREAPDLPDPILEAVIEIDLAQDSTLDAGMRRGGMKDDSVAAIWRRLVIIPMGESAETPTAYRAKAYECHRGPRIPPEGGLCP